DGVAREPRHGGLRETDELLVRVAIEDAEGAGASLVAPRRPEIEARAEESARAAEDHAADRIVRSRGIERRRQIAEQRLVERIGRRPVEHQDTNATGPILAPNRRHARWACNRAAREGSIGRRILNRCAASTRTIPLCTRAECDAWRFSRCSRHSDW